MFYDNAEGAVFRPPSEANSLIVRVSIGCSHNACTFCSMYRQVKFRIRPVAEIRNIIAMGAALYPQARRVFLADGNALVLPAEQLLEICRALHQALPRLSRITCYGAPRDILGKSAAELAALHAAGLQIVYMGIESGDDVILKQINKGVSAHELIKAGQKITASGIRLSAMVILGLGGTARTHEHAHGTAMVVNAINPAMLSALTLMLSQGTPMRSLAEHGRFQPLSEYGFINELAEMLTKLELTKYCLFRSNHVSNFLPLAGTLPKDKQRLLQEVTLAKAQLRNDTEPCFNDDGPY